MPATAIAVPLVVPVLSWVVNKLGDYLLHEANLLSDVREDVQRLKTELERIQNFLRNAASLGEHWVKEIRDIAHDVEDIVETYMYRRRYATSLFERLFCRLRYRLQKKIKKIDEKIKEIHNSKDRYPTPSSTQLQRPSPPHCYSNEVVGFGTEEKQLVSQLRNAEPQNLRVFSIVGMGGQGKTTLANQVYYSDEIIKGFPIRVWVHVCVNAETSVVLRKIIKGMSGLEATADLTEDQLTQSLKSLEIPKRYLIVLDDVWEAGLWVRIKTALPDGNNGSRVLLTTRSIYVARYADPQTTHTLRFLDEKESMNLFLNSIYPHHNDQESFSVVVQELAKRCHGLPLALVNLGKYLTTKDEDYHQWPRVVRELSWQENEVKECTDSLGLSYNHLPYHLKLCFLYLASFPQSYKIRARRLLRLWEAEGFEDRKETTEKFLDKLIQSCMVQVAERHHDNSIRRVCVHELLQELCIEEARKDNFLNVGNSSDHAGEIRRLALHKNIQDHYRDKSGKWQTPKLRSLLGFNLEDSNVGKSFEGLHLLRVIDLHGAMGLKTLPNKIKNMYFLKYLRLRGNCGSTFLVLGLNELHYLQTLDANCWKPANSLSLTGSQRNLKLLRGVKAGKWIQTELLNLSSLEKLGICNVTYHYENSLLKALARLSQLLSLTLDAEIDNDDGSIPSDVFTCFLNGHPLLSLKLRGRLSKPDYHLPKTLEFPQRLTKLVLKRSELKIDPMATLEKLEQLLYLELSEGAYLGKRMQCTKEGFCSLQSMILADLPNLEQWKVEVGAMPKLIHLTIECPKLENCDNILPHVTRSPNCKCRECKAKSDFRWLRGMASLP